jgi:hypothetical protein
MSDEQEDSILEGKRPVFLIVIKRLKGEKRLRKRWTLVKCNPILLGGCV